MEEKIIQGTAHWSRRWNRGWQRALHPTDNQRLAGVTSFRVRYQGCFSCEAALFFVILHRLKGTNGQRVN